MSAWNAECVPQEGENAILITLLKKGDRSECINYKGISPLSVADYQSIAKQQSIRKSVPHSVYSPHCLDLEEAT